MLSALRNKIYVAYINYLYRSSTSKKYGISKKLSGVAIRCLAALFLAKAERKTLKNWIILKTSEEVKKVACTFCSRIVKSEIPSINFLQFPDQKKWENVSFEDPIYHAIYERNLSKIYSALPTGIKKSAQAKYLALAVKWGDLEAIILMQKAQWIKGRKQKIALLELAIEHGQLSILEFFLGDQVDVNTKTKYGTLLAAAFALKKTEVAKFLIKKGASFQASKKQVKAIFDQITLKKNRELAELFIQKGLPRSWYSRYQLELLDLVSRFGFLEFLKNLGDSCLNVKKSDKKSKQNLLIPAIQENQEAIAQYLIVQGVQTNKQDCDPLIEAAFESFSLVKLFAEHHLEVDLVNKWGFSPLLVAFTEGNQECADYLIEKGANVARSQNIRMQKLLSHLFALRGTSTIDSNTFKWEGMSYGFGIQALQENVKAFFDDLDKTQWPGERAQQEILEGLENMRLNRFSSKTDEEIVGDYENGKMVVLSAGWLGHAFYRVLYKGFYIEANRGQAFQKENTYGYKIWKMGASLTPELIKKMRAGEKKAYHLVVKDRKKIQHKLDLKLIVKGHLKKQKVGNCATANAKAIFRMMLLIHQFDSLRSHEMPEKAAEHLLKAEKISSKLYKNFTAHLREKVLQQAIAFYQDKPKKEIPFLLLLFVLAKFKGRPETSLSLARLLHSKGGSWKLKDAQGKGFVDYVRAAQNHTLIPRLLSEGLLFSSL